MNPRIKKVALVVFGLLLLGVGLFLTFGIALYSAKEGDDNVIYGYVISIGLVCAGIYFLIKGIKMRKAATKR